jgi:hypothetical protein
MMGHPTDVTGPNTEEPRENIFFSNESNGRVARESRACSLTARFLSDPFGATNQ